MAVLRAISLTETGRKTDGVFRPWPWTVNMEGKGVWFDSRQDAQEFADKNFNRGARSFDVGCFQLNYRWHNQGFSSIEEMFDPGKNATYAANFLHELFLEKGNWPDAAGAYHSRTPKFANKYKKRFEALLAKLVSEPLTGPPIQTITDPINSPANLVAVRMNNFPLLLGGSGAASLGSLMPASAGLGAPRLIGGG